MSLSVGLGIICLQSRLFKPVWKHEKSKCTAQGKNSNLPPHNPSEVSHAVVSLGQDTFLGHVVSLPFDLIELIRERAIRHPHVHIVELLIMLLPVPVFEFDALTAASIRVLWLLCHSLVP